MRASIVSRTFIAVLAAVLTGLLSTSCGGGAGALRQPSLDPDGGGGLPPVAVTVTHVLNTRVTLVSTDELAGVTLYFSNGTSEEFDISGLAASVTSNSSAHMSYLKAQTRGGDYWYFDKAGLWLPNGYDPKVDSSVRGKSAKGTSGVWVGDSYVSVTSSDVYSEVKVGFNDGTTQTFHTSATSGMYELHIPAENVSAVRLTLQADGTKWYFDVDGNPLPADSKWYQDMD